MTQVSPRPAAVAQTDFTDHFVNRILNDHRAVWDLFKKYKGCTDNIEDRKKAVMDIVRTISQHGVAEEMAIYPLFSKYLKNGEEAAQCSRKEHNELKKALYEVERTNMDDKAFEKLMEKVMKDFTDHAQHEEQNELPALKEAITNEEAVRIGKKFLEARDAAPTRPHPDAPDSGGVMERLAGMASKPIDKIRDAFSSK